MQRVGVDIIKIERIKGLSDLKKIFHDSELKKSELSQLAGIFSLKEACFKALDIKKRWLEIEVRYEKSGKPFLVFSSELNSRIKNSSCSISHDGEYAVSFVLIEEQTKN